MKLDYIAPIVISNCIEYLNTRPIGTTYHPEKHKIILNGKTAARIMRHDCVLNSKVTSEEKRFFTRLLKHTLNEINIIESVIDNKKYSISEYSKFGEFSIEINRVKKIKNKRGRKPKFLGDVKYVSMGHN